MHKYLSYSTLSLSFVAAALVCAACSSSSSTPTPDSGVPEDAGDDTTVDASTETPSDAGAEDASTDAEACHSCSTRLQVDFPQGPVCKTNGSPSSFELLAKWGQCICGAKGAACSELCPFCTDNSKSPTDQCFDCGKEYCSDEYEACAADVGEGD